MAVLNLNLNYFPPDFPDDNNFLNLRINCGDSVEFYWDNGGYLPFDTFNYWGYQQNFYPKAYWGNPPSEPGPLTIDFTPYGGGTLNVTGPYAATYAAPGYAGYIGFATWFFATGNTINIGIWFTNGPVISPAGPLLINSSATQVFTASGLGPFTWSLPTNNSGGSIDSSSGLYTAGYVPGSTNAQDIVQCTDSLGNSSMASISVASAMLKINPAGPITLLQSASQQITGTGGQTPYTWSILVNNSGGTVSSGGLYTAGIAGGSSTVVDTVEVTDNLAATATCSVTVTPKLTMSPTIQFEVQSTTQEISAYGGSPPYFWAISEDNSGGFLNTLTGTPVIYTAGTAGGNNWVNDTVLLQDSAAAMVSQTFPVVAPMSISFTGITLPISYPSSPFNVYKSLLSKPSSWQASVVGGKGPYTWSLSTNVSGATIDPVSGIYTAGPNSGSDVIQVQDSLDEVAYATVNVCTVIGLSVAPNTYTMSLGQTARPTLTASLGIGDTQYFTSTWNANASWSSNDYSSTLVDSMGTIQKVSIGGPDTITATDVDSGQYATVTVSFTSLTDGLQSITVTGAKETLNMGATQQYKAVGTYLAGYQYDITKYVTWGLV